MRTLTVRKCPKVIPGRFLDITDAHRTRYAGERARAPEAEFSRRIARGFNGGAIWDARVFASSV